MRSKVIKTLFKKEMLDVLRDRKAILMLVLVPLLIYPLILFGSFAVMSMIQTDMEQREYRVLDDTDDNGAFAEELNLYNYNQLKASKTDKGSETNASSEKAIDRLKIVKLEDEELTDETINKALQEERIDVYITS